MLHLLFCRKIVNKEQLIFSGMLVILYILFPCLNK